MASARAPLAGEHTGRVIAFFNPNRPSYVEDPYPALARLRDEDPVYRSREMDGWILTRYDDCLDVLRDRDRFVSDTAKAAGRVGEHVRALRKESPLGDAPLFGQTDPPDHPRLRGIINRAFTPRVIEAHRERIAGIVAGLLDALEPGTPFDFMSTLAEVLPVLVIADLLGLDEENRVAVRQRAQLVMRAVSDDRLTPTQRREAFEARDWLRDFLEEYGRTHRDADGQRLISLLLEAEAEGGRLAVDELLAFTVFLYTAGSGPTAGLLGNGLAALLTHPEAMAELRTHSDRLVAATDEMLRYNSPTQTIVRVAGSDAEIGRRRVAEGESLLLMVGAANRDPEAFPDPDAFDLGRERAGRHLSFGYGAHFCLGGPLAQLEAEILFRTLFERFSTLELAPGGLEWGGTFMIRVPRRLVLVGR